MVVRSLERRLVALCVFLAAGNAAHPAFSQGGTKITGPASVVTAPDTSVTLRLSLALPNISETAVQLVPTAGDIRSLRRVAAGEFEADFLPPNVAAATRVSIYPQVANRRIPSTPFEIEVVPNPTRGRRLLTGPFSLEVPTYYVLGSNDTPSISMRAHNGVRPIVRVNVGTLSEPKEGADGRLHASYAPPSEKYPQLAIIVAITPDGRVVDWAAFPLLGSPQVKTSSPPFAQVRVRVGSNTYGPYRAGPDGRVDVPVLVSPGQESAEVTARDSQGRQRAAIVALGTPALMRGFAVCPPKEESILYVVAQPSGAPDRADRARISAAGGRVSAIAPIAAGVVRADFTPPPEARVGEGFTVSASLPDAPNADASCQRVFLGETPTSMQLRFDRGEFIAGSGGPVKVRVSYEHPGKRAPYRPIPRFETSFGTLGEPRPSRGGFDLDWHLPNAFEGRSSARLTAFAGAKLQSASTIALRAGPSKEFSVSSSVSSLPADGSSEAALSVAAKDGYGNIVVRAKLSAAGRGSIGPFEPSATGLRATYRAPRSVEAYDDVVVVRDVESGAEGRVRIRLKAGGGRWFAWLRVGYSSNFGSLNAPVAALGVGMRTLWLNDRFAASLEVSHLVRTRTQLDEREFEEVTNESRVTPLLLRGGIDFPLESFTPYIVVGAGAAFVYTSVSSDSSGEVAKTSVAPAIAPRLGAFVPFGPGDGLVEAGYLHAPFEAEAVQGNGGGADVSLGYRLSF